MSTLCPFVTASPGTSYGAQVAVRDLESDLLFEKTIRYIAPLTLPTGIALKVSASSGQTKEIDLTSVSVEDLDRLAAYSRSLADDHVQTASKVTIDDFLTTYASSEKAFPV